VTTLALIPYFNETITVTNGELFVAALGLLFGKWIAKKLKPRQAISDAMAWATTKEAPPAPRQRRQLAAHMSNGQIHHVFMTTDPLGKTVRVNHVSTELKLTFENPELLRNSTIRRQFVRDLSAFGEMVEESFASCAEGLA
jgi:hypothetical protein